MVVQQKKRSLVTCSAPPYLSLDDMLIQQFFVQMSGLDDDVDDDRTEATPLVLGWLGWVSYPPWLGWLRAAKANMP